MKEVTIMFALEVRGLNKKYEKFCLKDISFNLEKGYIMGFIGSNGAGKTTTLQSIMNMVRADSGEVSIFGENFLENEMALKQDIGCTFGGVDYYVKSKIKHVTDVVKRFYNNWNDEVYRSYLRKFKLDEDKKISELSDGMKLKYSLTLALSHDAKLFILDEPTSGLDPVARDGLLELFQELVEDGEKSILFSTHITSDLEKCADYITYIKNGRLIASATKENFIESYRLVNGPSNQLELIKDELISYKTNTFGFTGLMKTKEHMEWDGIRIGSPTLDEIMVYHAKKEDDDDEEFTV